MTVRIGISGWTYPPWRGVFFPPGLKQKQELPYAASRFRTIEVNGTFYGLQRPEAFAAWADAVPEDFVFSVKGSRFITHIRRLREPETLLANFIASGLLRLGRKLGPILWQLPPTFRFDAERIGAFLAALPHDTEAASRIAARHDKRVEGRVFLDPAPVRPMRHAMEVRHESFRCREFLELLREHDVALVCADTVSWPRLGDVASDFVYCRLHGSEELYASGYDSASISEWAARVKTWASGGTPRDLDLLGPPAPRRPRDVFVYFDNDIKVRAPHDAQALADLLKVGPPESSVRLLDA
jgi:uncharacterized protein YecE (DUF72 family)